MDEARAVLQRIRRIDALQRERAGSPALLAELDRLVVEARAWLCAEGRDDAAAAEPGGAHGGVDRSRKEMIAM
jgi:hypothetical protein